MFLVAVVGLFLLLVLLQLMYWALANGLLLNRLKLHLILHAFLVCAVKTHVHTMLIVGTSPIVKPSSHMPDSEYPTSTIELTNITPAVISKTSGIESSGSISSTLTVNQVSPTFTPSKGMYTYSTVVEGIIMAMLF